MDYTGCRFGHLVVMEMLYGYGKHGEAYCRCVCDCGAEVIKQSYDIRHSRNPAHCGCMKSFYRDRQSENVRQDLVGQRFGRLVVTKMIYGKNRQTRVECVCDCGNTITRIATYLTSGNTTSCGCYQRERASEASTKDHSGTESDYGVKFESPAFQNKKGQWMWNCRCQCGNEFVALPARVNNGHITSCGCAKRSSRERFISKCLDDLGVYYTPEYRFADCKDEKELPFDFYVPSYNTIIEYHGQQHYYPIDYFGGETEFKKRAKHDKIKRKYCKDNNIRLVELPYSLTDAEIKEEIQTLFIRRDCNG